MLSKTQLTDLLSFQSDAYLDAVCSIGDIKAGDGKALDDAALRRRFQKLRNSLNFTYDSCVKG